MCVARGLLCLCMGVEPALGARRRTVPLDMHVKLTITSLLCCRAAQLSSKLQGAQGISRRLG
jgi:hypothetical protein